jgi:hypothetical protein
MLGGHPYKSWSSNDDDALLAIPRLLSSLSDGT